MQQFMVNLVAYKTAAGVVRSIQESVKAIHKSNIILLFLCELLCLHKTNNFENLFLYEKLKTFLMLTEQGFYQLGPHKLHLTSCRLLQTEN